MSCDDSSGLAFGESGRLQRFTLECSWLSLLYAHLGLRGSIPPIARLRRVSTDSFSLATIERPWPSLSPFLLAGGALCPHEPLIVLVVKDDAG